MKVMKQFSVLASIAICSSVFLGMAHASYAAVLKFDPTSVTAGADNTFDVDIVVDAEEDEISGTDVYILYDETLVEPTAVTEGDYFPVVSNTIDTEKIYINGVVKEATEFKTGSGVLATVTFQMKSGSAGTLQFYCDLTQSDTSKVVKNDVNATNVIDCNNLNLFSINGGTGPQDAVPTPTTLPQTGGTVASPTPITQIITTTNVTTLPQSGIFENILKYSIPGVVMLALGVIIKVFI